MKNHDDFDELLHEALSEYRDAAPLSGLEVRVLLRLAEPREQFKTLWLKGIAVTASAAVLVIAVWISTRHRSVAPQSQPVLAVSEPMPSIEPRTNGRQHAEPPKVAPSRSVRRNVVAQVTQTSRSISEQFPTPVPLTESERVFLAASAEQADALRNQPEPDQPLSIAEIAIKPLAKDDQTSGENQ